MQAGSIGDVIISDTSCLLAFYEIGEMSILQRVCGKIITTSAVQREFELLLPSWIVVCDPPEESIRYIQERFKLDPGETTAIALALSHPDSMLIIDEVAGRRVAKELGIQITGTLGILLEAKRRGIVSTMHPLIRKLQASNFRMSKTLIAAILTEAEEN